ncbi:hypothetical protein J4Q44_G00281930 [Coregonus suidteri]|uniref:Uncharacterized protein n=1 Tax=Coregonus suidteri TaxID=861788 RepID=A0AAN8LAH3_9TELE
MVHMAGRTYSNTERCESLSADEEVPMQSSGPQSWSWGLKGIPCNWSSFKTIAYSYRVGHFKVGKQAQVYNCGSFHLQRIGKRTSHGE